MSIYFCIYPFIVLSMVIASGLLLIAKMLCKLPEGTSLKFLAANFVLLIQGVYLSIYIQGFKEVK